MVSRVAVDDENNGCLLLRVSAVSSTGRTTLYSTYRSPKPVDSKFGMPSPSITCTNPIPGLSDVVEKDPAALTWLCHYFSLQSYVAAVEMCQVSFESEQSLRRDLRWRDRTFLATLTSSMLIVSVQ